MAKLGRFLLLSTYVGNYIIRLLLRDHLTWLGKIAFGDLVKRIDITERIRKEAQKRAAIKL